METPLLATKVRVPPRRRELVPRPRLLAQLDQVLHYKLTLLSAPAGFGKTTLVAAWAAEQVQDNGIAVGWLTVDEGDDDVVRFLSYLVAAMVEAVPALAEEVEALLHSPHPPPVDVVITTLINQMAGMDADKQQYLLIIDDYHLVSAAAIHEALAFLLEHQPAGFHLVILTRADPPLPLPRLRGRGELLEIRQPDLRFSTAEAGRFLKEVMDLPLADRDVAILATRTEGWIAGLQMAALALRGRPEPETAQFAAEFTGTHRYVLDYLLEEVLQRQPVAVQEFLLKTSILESLTAPLCDYVLDGDDQSPETSTGYPTPRAQELLSYLDAHNLFLIPLDEQRRWYRTHRLFGDLLQLRLEQTLPDQLPRLHRRAAAWYEAAGETTAAIEHLLAAGDVERAATLVDANAERAVMRGQIMTLIRWAETLPDAAIASRPQLALLTAWSLFLGGRPASEMERLLRQVEAEPATSAWTGAIRGYIHLFQSEMNVASRLAQQALTSLPDEAVFLRQIALLVQNLAAHYDKTDAASALAEASQAGAAADNILVAVFGLCMRADLAQRDGDLIRAQVIYEQALSQARKEERLLPVASEPLLGLANLALECCELAKAEQLLADGLALAERWSKVAALDGYLLQARLHHLRGEHAAMWAMLDEATALTRRIDAVEVDDLIVDLFRSEKEIVMGHLDAARQRLRMLDLHPEAIAADLAVGAPPTRKYEYRLLARLRLAEGQAAEAARLLDTLLPYFERHRARIVLHLLRALACEQQGYQEAALAALVEALTLGEASGMMAVFVEEGEPVARLLYRALEGDISPAYVSRLLGQFPEPPDSETVPPGQEALIEPLSERELEVLTLVAEGLTNQAIANRLFLSLATVKWHTSNIYGKLEVGNRTEAVARARALGVLSSVG